MTEKRRVITNTLANGIAQFVSMASALVFMPFLVRSFGLNDFGLYLLALAVASYASIADFGVGAALVKQTAEHLASNDHEGIRKLASTALAFYLAIGLVVAVLVSVLALFSGAIFSVDSDGARLIRNLLLIAGVSALWTWPLNTANGVLQGFQRQAILARTALFMTLGNVGVTLVVLAMHEGPVALLVGVSAVSFIGGITNLLIARRLIRADTEVSPLDADAGVFREIVSFSWAVFVIQVCVLIIYQQTDRLLLGIFIGATAVGLYEAAGKFQGFVSQLTGLTTGAVMPVASQLQAEGRDSALQTLFMRGTKYVLAFIAPVVVVLMVLAYPLILHWLGPQFAPYAVAAQILISHQLLTLLTPIGDSILIGLGKLPKRLPYAVGVSIGNLVLSLLLIQPLGIFGVVLGTTIPYFVDFPFHIRMLVKETGLPWTSLWRRVILPTYPLLLVPLVMALAALRTPLMNSLLGVAFAAAASVTAYWAGFLMLSLDDIEREELSSLWARVRARLSS